MDKFIKAKLDSFDFSQKQKELLVDVIKYIATEVSSGNIDVSVFATKEEVQASNNHILNRIDEYYNRVWANTNNIDIITNRLNNNYYTKKSTDQKIDARIQQVVGAAPEALDTLEEIADRLKEDNDAINAINGVLAGKVSNDTFNEYKDTVTSLIPTKVSDLERDDIYYVYDIFNLKENSTAEDLTNSLGTHSELLQAVNDKRIIIGITKINGRVEHVPISIFSPTPSIVIINCMISQYGLIKITPKINWLAGETTPEWADGASIIKIDTQYLNVYKITLNLSKNSTEQEIIDSLGDFSSFRNAVQNYNRIVYANSVIENNSIYTHVLNDVIVDFRLTYFILYYFENSTINYYKIRIVTNENGNYSKYGEVITLGRQYIGTTTNINNITNSNIALDVNVGVELNNKINALSETIGNAPTSFKQLEDVYVFPGNLNDIEQQTNSFKLEEILGSYNDLKDAYDASKIFITNIGNSIKLVNVYINQYGNIDLYYASNSTYIRNINIIVNLITNPDGTVSKYIYAIMRNIVEFNLLDHEYKLTKLAPITNIYNFEEFDSIISNDAITTEEIINIIQPKFWNLSEAIYNHKMIICTTGNNSIIYVNANAVNEYDSATNVNGVPVYTGTIHISGIMNADLCEVYLHVTENTVDDAQMTQRIMELNGNIYNVRKQIDSYHSENSEL